MATTVMTSDVAKVHAAGSESAADSESAALLRRLHAVEKRHGEAPTNFHHAAIAEPCAKTKSFCAGALVCSAVPSSSFLSFLSWPMRHAPLGEGWKYNLYITVVCIDIRGPGG